MGLAAIALVTVSPARSHIQLTSSCKKQGARLQLKKLHKEPGVAAARVHFPVQE